MTEREAEVLEKLRDIGALQEGHFKLGPDRHTDTYVDNNALIPHTRDVSQLCWFLAEHFTKDQPEAVIAPASVGIVLSQWTADHLSELHGQQVLSLYTEKPTEDGVVIIPGYQAVIPQKRILVVDGVLSTGETISKVVRAIRDLRGKVVGVGALCNRGKVTKKSAGNPQSLFALANVKLNSWDAGKCPLCQQGISLDGEEGHAQEPYKISVG